MIFFFFLTARVILTQASPTHFHNTHFGLSFRGSREEFEVGLNPHVGIPGLTGVCLQRPNSQAPSSHLSYFKCFTIHLAVSHSSIHWLACSLSLLIRSFIHFSLNRASVG